MAKMGRPTKYKPRFCKDIIKFFDIKPFYAMEIEYKDKNGNIYKTDTKFIPNDLPTLMGFARKVNVDTDTLVEWTKKYKNFSVAVARAKTMQQDILVQNGLSGRYDAGFAKFVATNFTDMRDKQEQEHSGNINLGVAAIAKAVQEQLGQQKDKEADFADFESITPTNPGESSTGNS
jgi:hypothetical protein